MLPLWLESAVLDLRFGARALKNAPAFTAFAVATLALGVGANTAIFSIVNSVIVAPLPFTQPDLLVVLYEKTPVTRRYSVSYPNFEDWQRQNRTFSVMAACRPDNFVMTGEGRAERLHAAMISAELFPALDVQPLLGRALRPEDDRAGGGRVVMLDEDFWRRRFAASKDVLGRAIRLKGVVYTIIGVAPRSLHALGRLIGPADVYVAIGQWDDPSFRDRKVTTGMHVVARRMPAVHETSAQVDLERIAANLAAAYPDANRDVGITVEPLKETLVGGIKPVLLVLLGAAGFVLLISCANVGNLLLARSTGRTREFGTRIALGAGKRRLTTQLFTESVLLAAIGGGFGLALAFAGMKLLLASAPVDFPRAGEVRIDLTSLAFTMCVCFLAAIVFGLAPTLRALGADLHSDLKEGGRGSSGRQHRIQSVFVIAEIALALVLLAGSGLMIRSLANLWKARPGFDPHNVLAFELMPSPGVVSSPAKIRALFRNAVDQLEALPGIEAAAVVLDPIPLSGTGDAVTFLREGQRVTNAPLKLPAIWYFVEPDYFRTMGIRLVRGRLFSRQDDEHAPHVMVIDESFAHSVFPNQDPLGQRIDVDFIGLAEIVGVVHHVNHWNLGGDPPSVVTRQMYFPAMQLADHWLRLAMTGGMNVVTRTRSEPLTFAGAVRAQMDSMDPDQAMYGERSMDQVVQAWLATRRYLMVLLSVFAALALVLASIGIYGVLAYLVGQRTQEIGIRMALGARPMQILVLIFRHGGKLVLMGMSIGVAAAVALTRLMTSLLYGVAANDPLTFAGVVMLLGLVAAAACAIPARHAMRIDPTLALRRG